MGNYITDFGRALGNSEFIKLTFQAFGVFVGIIILFLIAKIIKSTINTKIKNIKNLSIDFNDVKRMRRTGLISEEEFENIKTGLVKQFVDTQAADVTGESTAKPPAQETFHLPVKKDQPSPMASPKTPKSPPTSSGSSAIDIDDLLKRGIITREEFQRLSEISRKNSTSQ